MTTGLSVQSWTVDRGRSFELDKIGTGTASIQGVDTAGALDPTNMGGPFYGNLDPMKQARLRLTNPATATTSTVFRGHIDTISYDVDVSERYARFQVDLVDPLDWLASPEVVPGQAGTTVPAGSEGDCFYAAQQVDDRIKAALADAGWPTGLQEIFSGNVAVQDTVYAPRSQILSVIDDACDAEFPGVGTRYFSRDGFFIFHGRLARFNPADYEAGGAQDPPHPISQWYAGDEGATADDRFGLISSLKFSRSKDHLINACIATPQNVADNDIAGQLSDDPTSITNYGLKSLSFENLLTLNGDESPTPFTALQETKLFADYVTDNYSLPRNRIDSVTFRPQNPDSTAGANTWAIICGVELGDLINIHTTHPGGGGFPGPEGFGEPFFVEGIHYQVTPMSDRYPEVTLTLDLSPAAYYTTNPFS